MNSLSVLKRGLATSAARSAIKNVTVIGGGLMGSGIAQVSYYIIIVVAMTTFRLY